MQILIIEYFENILFDSVFFSAVQHFHSFVTRDLEVLKLLPSQNSKKVNQF